MDKKKPNVIPFDKKVTSDKKNYSIGYKMGSIFAVAAGMCLTSVMVALTAKFILWLLF